MPTIGHVIFGAALGRAYGRGQAQGPRAIAEALAGATLAALPDLDFIGRLFGTSGELGHRGATHALSFACVCGVVLGWAVSHHGEPRARAMLFASLAIASHGLLDLFTDCSTGVALFWPLSATRFLASWRPVPAVPISRELFEARGLLSVLRELLLFAPLLAYALWPQRVHKGTPSPTSR